MLGRIRTRMETPIVATYRWSKDEFLRSQRLAVRHSKQGGWLYRVTALIGGLILLSGVVNLYMRPSGWPAFLFTAAVSAFFFSMPFFARLTALKLYAQKPDRDMEVTWHISDERVTSKTELASSENSWAFFLRVLRLPEGFLLYPNDRIFHWLPLHAFCDPRDVERFAELAKAKAKEYRHVA
jgi:YcxB-like protein